MMLAVLTSIKSSYRAALLALWWNFIGIKSILSHSIAFDQYIGKDIQHFFLKIKLSVQNFLGIIFYSFHQQTEKQRVLFDLFSFSDSIYLSFWFSDQDSYEIFILPSLESVVFNNNENFIIFQFLTLIWDRTHR